MVLHHVHDIENIIRKFRNLLCTGVNIEIADLYPEDGSFHGPGFEGHKGFDVNELSQLIGKLGFKNIMNSASLLIRNFQTLKPKYLMYFC